MKSLHNSECKEVSHIECQPIIAGGPNDHSTIYNTLLCCIKRHKLKVLIITLDLSIFLKSVDIIPSQKLAIVPRLNGYHLLKSAEEVADNILNNNTYDKAIRVYFLIDAAIGQHIPSKNQFFSTAR